MKTVMTILEKYHFEIKNMKSQKNINNSTHLNTQKHGDYYRLGGVFKSLPNIYDGVFLVNN